MPNYDQDQFLGESYSFWLGIRGRLLQKDNEFPEYKELLVENIRLAGQVESLRLKVKQCAEILEVT